MCGFYIGLFKRKLLFKQLNMHVKVAIVVLYEEHNLSTSFKRYLKSRKIFKGSIDTKTMETGCVMVLQKSVTSTCILI